MPKAIWNGAVLAQSDAFEMVEGNVYFPRESIDRKYFRDSRQHSTCPRKGIASYLDVVVDGQVNADAAWYYPDPTPAARHIAGYVAFWHGVTMAK
jgi:uncharacterized protein (DUF427 family)